MGAGEFAQWLAYYAVERFGEARADIRTATLCALMANINRDPKTQPKPFTIADFLPDYWKDSADEASDLEMKMRMIAEAINAQNARDNHGLDYRDASD